MTLRPVLPVLPDESLSSYMNRVAVYHAGTDVFTFLGAIGLSRAEIFDPSQTTLDRIAELTGQPGDLLHRMVIRSVQPRIRALGNEHFHTEFANLKQTSFCPACLLEDIADGSPSGGHRVGRLSWRIEPVRTCRHHGMALVRTPLVGKSQRFQHMDDVAPSDAELVRLVDTAERRGPSTLQTYIETRFASGSGPEWLDDQPIDIAARACEMLGLLLTCPVTRKMPLVSSSELDTAGAVGFDYASRGEDGIRAALQTIHEQAKRDGFLGGPAQVYGFFHAWLQDAGKQKPFGPIRDIARDHVLEAFPIEAGTSLYGEVVQKQTKHTVYTLARKLGSHPRTVQRALVYAGTLNGDPECASHHDVFDAGPAEALFARINTALSNRDLRKFLNCHRT